MAKLTFDVAQNLVGYLIAIGHPYQEKAVNATAMLLCKWCAGPLGEQQAQALVEDAAENWERWPEGGTKALLDLFRGKFPRKEQAPDARVSDGLVGSLIERGLVAPPCELCEPGAPSCEFGGIKSHRAAQKGTVWAIGIEEAAARPAVYKKQRPVTDLSFTEILRQAEASWELEKIRKRAQLGKVEQQLESA